MRAHRVFVLVAVSLALALMAAPALGATRFESVTSDGTGWRIAGGYDGPTDRVGVLAGSDNGTDWNVAEVPGEHFVGASLGSGNAWAVSSYTNAAWNAASSPLTAVWNKNALSGAPATLDLWDVTAMGASSAVIVGERQDMDYGTLATAWRTLDGGSTWVETLAEPRYPASGDGGIPQSAASLASVDANGTFVVAAGNEFYDVVGGSVKRPLVFSSGDGAGTWALSSPVAVTWEPRDVDVTGANTAWIAGSASTVVKTTDGGSTWQPIVVPRDPANNGLMAINGIAASDASHAIVVGDAGKIARTSDGGTTWTFSTPLAGLPVLRSVAMRSATEAIAVGGDNADAYLSTDSGATWTAIKNVMPSVAAPCTIKVTAPATIPYGGTASISASLRDAGNGFVAGRKLVLERASGSSWVTVQTLTSASKDIVFTHKPTTKTTYRIRHALEADLLAATSSTFVVAPQVYLSTPVMSSISGRTLTLTGYLKPRHTAGTKITIYTYRLSGGAWVRDKSFYAKASNYSSYSKYSVRFTVPRAATWHFKAGAPADSAHATTYSPYSKSRALK